MEESLEEALRLKAKELRNTLIDLKKHDFDINVEKLKANLPKRKRCIICTLKIPCKHFKHVKEIPKISIHTSEEKLVKDTEEVIDFSQFVPNFPKETKKIGFTVNYRGRELKYYIDPHIRTTSLPNERRFNLLCTIEAYREEKLQEELKKLEKARDEEQKKIQEKQQCEDNKKKYQIKQKERLLKYREDMKEKREQLRNLIDLEDKQKKMKEKKLQKYYDMQKKALADYNQKKSPNDTTDVLLARELEGISLPI